MSDNTNTAEELFPIDLNQQEFQGSRTKFAKGDHAGKEKILIKPVTDDLDFITKIANAVGIQNFIRSVYKELIAPACVEASIEAHNDQGIIEESKFLTAFVDAFAPTTRKSGGPSLKDLQGVVANLYKEMQPYLGKYQTGRITDEEKLACARLVAEVEKLNEQIEKKTRKGKKAENTAVDAPEAVG